MSDNNVKMIGEISKNIIQNYLSRVLRKMVEWLSSCNQLVFLCICYIFVVIGVTTSFASSSLFAVICECSRSKFASVGHKLFISVNVSKPRPSLVNVMNGEETNPRCYCIRCVFLGRSAVPVDSRVVSYGCARTDRRPANNITCISRKNPPLFSIA